MQCFKKIVFASAAVMLTATMAVTAFAYGNHTTSNVTVPSVGAGKVYICDGAGYGCQQGLCGNESCLLNGGTGNGAGGGAGLQNGSGRAAGRGHGGHGGHRHDCYR